MKTPASAPTWRKLSARQQIDNECLKRCDKAYRGNKEHPVGKVLVSDLTFKKIVDHPGTRFNRERTLRYLTLSEGKSMFHVLITFTLSMISTVMQAMATSTA